MRLTWTPPDTTVVPLTAGYRKSEFEGQVCDGFWGWGERCSVMSVGCGVTSSGGREPGVGGIECRVRVEEKATPRWCLSRQATASPMEGQVFVGFRGWGEE